jgi:hypothetical protein
MHCLLAMDADFSTSVYIQESEHAQLVFSEECC